MMLTNTSIKPMKNKTSSFGVLSSKKINPSEWRSELQDRLNGNGVADKKCR